MGCVRYVDIWLNPEEIWRSSAFSTVLHHTLRNSYTPLSADIQDIVHIPGILSVLCHTLDQRRGSVLLDLFSHSSPVDWSRGSVKVSRPQVEGKRKRIQRRTWWRPDRIILPLLRTGCFLRDGKVSELRVFAQCLLIMSHVSVASISYVTLYRTLHSSSHFLIDHSTWSLYIV